MAEILYRKPIVNSLGQPLQDMRWCVKFAAEDAKLDKEASKLKGKELEAWIEKRAKELFKIHGEKAN